MIMYFIVYCVDYILNCYQLVLVSCGSLSCWNRWKAVYNILCKEIGGGENPINVSLLYVGDRNCIHWIYTAIDKLQGLFIL